LSSPAFQLPALVAAADGRTRKRFLEFFAAQIRNRHTRRAYYRAAEEFLAWCTDAGVRSIAAVEPVHVATWIEASTRELAAPSVKQRLAALRQLFDWLVNGQVVPDWARPEVMTVCSARLSNDIRCTSPPGQRTAGPTNGLR